MNNKRRKELDEIYGSIEDIKYKLESILADEENYRDSIPENLQGSERYETADEACDALSNAVDSVDEIFEYIEQARGRQIGNVSEKMLKEYIENQG